MMCKSLNIEVRMNQCVGVFVFIYRCVELCLWGCACQSNLTKVTQNNSKSKLGGKPLAAFQLGGKLLEL